MDTLGRDRLLRGDEMEKYHKIQTMFKRDMANRGRLMVGEWSTPELAYLADNDWTFTEKVDGTNIRVMFDGERVFFNGKTDNAQLHVELVERLHLLFDHHLELFRETFPPPAAEFGPTRVCFYGEGYGAGIQKGGCYLDHKDFVLFDVKVESLWLQREDVVDLAQKFTVEIVPAVGCGTLMDAVDMAREGFDSQWGDFTAEGIVCRPVTELCTRRGGRVITKIKHCDFPRDAT
jgi:hypothetical protein